MPPAEQPPRARPEQPFGVRHGVPVPSQIGFEQLDPAQGLTEPGFVTDEVVAENEELLPEPQILLGEPIAPRRDLCAELVALVWRTVVAHALTATERSVLHAGRD
jgi:hypothetical protein